ncbi:nucleotide exchange factor GrpE [Candidatus Micrarchaeota archaeon]|nr:nucleotide exchange factor GrpE [Candidatus Micrarchaeota archaeon]
MSKEERKEKEKKEKGYLPSGDNEKVEEISGKRLGDEKEYEKELPKPKRFLIPDCEDRYLRLQAEFQNYRRRVEKEKERMALEGSERLILKLLPFFDDFKLVVDERNKDRKHKELPVDVLIHLFNKLNHILSKEGLHEMKLIGERFNPTFHEAAYYRESDAESGTIIEIIRPGYMFKDRVLRHAIVGVSKGRLKKEIRKEERRYEDDREGYTQIVRKKDEKEKNRK